MRNLTKTLTAVSLMAPVSAFPLGIGDIKLHSALNQKLDAEIALLVSEDEKVSDIRVKLAPPDKFDEAGVPWSFFLSKIKFEPVVKQSGNTVIKVSSKEVLREPFLDFLVEVTWNKGNLYREFTVLVDPPVAYTQPVVPVFQQAEQHMDDQPEDTVAEQEPLVKEVNDPVEADEPLVIDGVYGPTKRNDSVWKIAEKTNVHSDISREQMMMAIYEANPQAFLKNNVNLLKAGKTLNIPEKETILKLSKKDAFVAFKQHNDEWSGRVKTSDPETSVAKIDEVNNQLVLKAPTQEEVDQRASVQSSQPDSTTNQSNDQQAGISSDDQTFALQARIEKLEEQLSMMQKLLVLKNEQIAALQAQGEENVQTEIQEQQKADGSISNLEQKLGVEPVEQPSSTESAQPEQQDKTVEQSKQGVKPSEQVVDSAPVEQDKPKYTSDSEPLAKQESESAPEDSGLISPATMGAIALPILGLIGWLLWRRGKEEEEVSESDSMFASATDIVLPDADGADDKPVKSPLVADSLDSEDDLLSEFAASDFNTFDKNDSEDVDPVLEADVYLAYGRYQQAEELMRQAIIDQPERDECKLKLLEIFYASENKEAFEQYSNELAESGKNNEQDFWSKVSAMGVELDIQSPLYDADSSSKTTSKKENKTEETMGLGSSLQEGHESPQIVERVANHMHQQHQDQSANGEEEFDLSIFDEDEDLNLDLDAKLTQDTNDLEFNLNSEAQDDEEQLSIDQDEPSLANDLSQIESVEFDLGSVDQEEEALDVKGTNDMDDIDSFEFDFDLDANSDKETVQSSIDEEMEINDLTDMDEIETKIDLAKAYVDMGDFEAARGIAQEVMEKGTDDQKKSAAEIIDMLD